MGMAIRAVSFNEKAAALMGVNVNRIISYTFAIGSALAAIAGIFYSMRAPGIDPLMGVQPGLRAFIAAVVGVDRVTVLPTIAWIVVNGAIPVPVTAMPTTRPKGDRPRVIASAARAPRSKPWRVKPRRSASFAPPP
jgi:ABC-type glucose/galactose transport system permease subunit